MAVAFTNLYGSSDGPSPPDNIGMGSNAVSSLYKVVNITATFVATNTIDIGWLPKGTIPIGGYFACADLDTGTEALDLDLGIVANGVDSADPDFFMNGGLFSGDPITDLPFTNSANYRVLTGAFPVLQLGAKTKVQLICNTIPATFAAGKAVVRIDYICPGTPTS